MLGELVLEVEGRVNESRGQSLSSRRAHMEVSFSAAGRLLGPGVMSIGTLVSGYPTPTGYWPVEAHGEAVTDDDGRTVRWHATGKGHATEEGVTWAGAGGFETEAESLDALNNMVAVIECDVSGDGEVRARFWEWTSGQSPIGAGLKWARASGG